MVDLRESRDIWVPILGGPMPDTSISLRKMCLRASNEPIRYQVVVMEIGEEVMDFEDEMLGVRSECEGI